MAFRGRQLVCLVDVMVTKPIVRLYITTVRCVYTMFGGTLDQLAMNVYLNHPPWVIPSSAASTSDVEVPRAQRKPCSSGSVYSLVILLGLTSTVSFWFRNT